MSLYVRIQGGLGNQLNTYSFGKALAKYMDAELVLDIEDYRSRRDVNGNPYRWPYFLEKLPIPERIAEKDEIFALKSFKEVGEANFKPHMFLEAAKLYEENGNTLHIDTMAGDWRYHEPVIGDIRGLFSDLPPLEGDSGSILAKINAFESVGVHFRFGDYLNDPDCMIMPSTYYRAALEILGRSVDFPYIFVFTDSPEIVRNNLKLDAPWELVDCNSTMDAVNDLRLMSACRHKIIANSSFSFWAARLDGRKGGLTMGPDTYFSPLRHRLAGCPQPEWPPEWRTVKVEFPENYLKLMEQRYQRNELHGNSVP